VAVGPTGDAGRSRGDFKFPPQLDLAPIQRTTQKCGRIHTKELYTMGRQSKFTEEEKLAAVRMVTEGGRTVLSVANEYGIHENTIWKWKRQYEINPEGAFVKVVSVDSNVETERLRRRVKELENEVEFLKKAAAYFAKNPQ